MCKKGCYLCNNPYCWEDIKIVDDMVHVKCKECGNEFNFKYHGTCKKCDFYLDKDGFCELCEE